MLGAVGALVLLGAAASGSARAEGSGLADTEAFMREVTTLQAHFLQTVVNPDGAPGEVSEGTLYISRPDRFRWHYSSPGEQQIIADGERFWLYDVDLDQVTVKALDRTLASSPAMLLSGAGRITDGFEVRAEFTGDGIDWVELVPREQDTDFRFVRLGFAAGELRVMELSDQLDQTTRIEFTDVVRNPELEASLFTFEPPEGVDVIGWGQNKNTVPNSMK